MFVPRTGCGSVLGDRTSRPRAARGWSRPRGANALAPPAVAAVRGPEAADARLAAMRAVVIYESLTGNTARAARLIADELATRGVEVAVYPITDIGLKDLAEADV